MSNLINKVKSSMHRDSEPHSSSNQYDNPRSSNEGPHGSNMMNKADPRVDSDVDHRNDPTSRAGGYGQTQNTGNTGYGTGTGTSGYNTTPTGGSNYNTTSPTTGSGHYPRDSGYSAGSGNTTTGPHNSNLANKMDPRVDSDQSQMRKPVGGTNTSSPGYGTSGNTGYSAPTGTAVGGGYGNTGHNAPTGTGVGGYGNTGQNAPMGTGVGSGYGNDYDNRSSNTAPHNSNIANKLDPRVDASRTDDHTTHTTARGTMEHDTRHTGAGQGSSNVSNTVGTGTDKLTHSTRHEGGGTYDSSAVHRSDAGHVDSSKTHHSGPGIHESSTTTGHNPAGATTSTTHTSTHSSGGLGSGNAGTGVGSGYNEPGYNESGYGTGSSATPGSASGNNTAGPHNSSLMNKLDPRVDSDRSQQTRRY